MELDFAFLADSAQAVGGKLFVLGGAFDTINAPKVPVIHNTMSLAVRLLFDVSEIGRHHQLEVDIVDADGRRIARAGGPLFLEKNPHTPAGWNQGFLAVVNFINLKFEKFGDYGVKIIFNNTTIKSIPLRVIEGKK